MSTRPPDDSHDLARGRFCPWYALGDVGARAPDVAGVYQVKRAGPLLDYPRGKSAMLRYGHGRRLSTVLAVVAEELSRHPDAARLLCRHQIVEDERAAKNLYQAIFDQFVGRFGAPPRLTPTAAADLAPEPGS